jgi:hypothetical protein
MNGSRELTERAIHDLEESARERVLAEVVVQIAALEAVDVPSNEFGGAPRLHIRRAAVLTILDEKRKESRYERTKGRTSSLPEEAPGDHHDSPAGGA